MELLFSGSVDSSLLKLPSQGKLMNLKGGNFIAIYHNALLKNQ